MNPSPSTRRDPRFDLADAAGEVSFFLGRADTGKIAIGAPLATVSVAGVSFRIPTEHGGSLERGAELAPATVRIGRCTVAGSLTIRNVQTLDDSVELGCLFVPDTEDEEARWMALLEGIEAGRPTTAAS